MFTTNTAIKTAVSAETGYFEFTEIPYGEYVLKEIAAPDGYVIATDISFEVFTDGSAIVENVDATAVTEDGHPLIVMVDNTTKVEISTSKKPF